MKKEQKDGIVSALLEKMNALTISNLWAALGALDQTRFYRVLDLLDPKKFKELIAHDRKMKCKEDKKNVVSIDHLYFGGHIGSRKCLDALPVPLLLYTGKRNSAGTGGWKDWSGVIDRKKLVTNTCDSLCEYFYGASPKRIASVLEFLIDSTKGVTAPASEKQYSIFKFEEEKQFPFEAIAMLATVHPRFLFPALELLDLDRFKRLLWLAEKGRGDNEYIACDFLNAYGKNYSYGNSFEPLCVIGKWIGALDNRKLYMLLSEFHSESQCILTEALGEARIRQMNDKKMFSKQIAVPDTFSLYVDKDSNDSVLERIHAGKLTIGRLTPQKTLELLGELA